MSACLDRLIVNGRHVESCLLPSGHSGRHEGQGDAWPNPAPRGEEKREPDCITVPNTREGAEHVADLIARSLGHVEGPIGEPHVFHVVDDGEFTECPDYKKCKLTGLIHQPLFDRETIMAYVERLKAEPSAPAPRGEVKRCRCGHPRKNHSFYSDHDECGLCNDDPLCDRYEPEPPAPAPSDGWTQEQIEQAASERHAAPAPSAEEVWVIWHDPKCSSGPANPYDGGVEAYSFYPTLACCDAPCERVKYVKATATIRRTK